MQERAVCVVEGIARVVRHEVQDGSLGEVDVLINNETALLNVRPEPHEGTVPPGPGTANGHAMPVDAALRFALRACKNTAGQTG